MENFNEVDIRDKLIMINSINDVHRTIQRDKVIMINSINDVHRTIQREYSII